MRKLYILVAILSMLLSSFRPMGYVDRLWDLRGIPYSTLTCSGFIYQAHDGNLNDQCGAFGMFVGTCGRQKRIAEYNSLNDVDRSILLPGDILAFHGDHVAVYAGDNTFLDSDWSHQNKGVGIMNPYGGNAAWFIGKVRIVRWR